MSENSISHICNSSTKNVFIVEGNIVVVVMYYCFVLGKCVIMNAIQFSYCFAKRGKRDIWVIGIRNMGVEIMTVIAL